MLNFVSALAKVGVGLCAGTSFFVRVGLPLDKRDGAVLSWPVLF